MGRVLNKSEVQRFFKKKDMIGILNEQQIDQFLAEQNVGRIGCHADDTTYVVPVTFVYDEGSLYGHTSEGLKVNMMRKNPSVCFQTDKIENPGNWKSVIMHGQYEELEGEEAVKGIRLLMERLMPALASESAMPTHGFDLTHPFKEKEILGIVYRIKVTSKTGRYEDK